MAVVSSGRFTHGIRADNAGTNQVGSWSASRRGFDCVCASGNDYGASDSFVIQLNIYIFLA